MICIRSSWCHCHPTISCSSKFQNGLPFWCQLNQVVLEKRPLNGRSSCSTGLNANHGILHGEHAFTSVSYRTESDKWHLPCKDIKFKTRNVVVTGQVNCRFQCHCFQWWTYWMYFVEWLTKLLPWNNCSAMHKCTFWQTAITLCCIKILQMHIHWIQSKHYTIVCKK